MSADELEVILCDSAGNFLGYLTPRSAAITPRFRGQGTGRVAVRAYDRSVPLLDPEQGVRVIVRLHGEHLMSGPITKVTGSVLARRDVVVYFHDDWEALPNHPAVIRPNGNIAATSASDLAQAVAVGPLTAGTVANQVGYMLWPDGSELAGGELVETDEAAIQWLLDTQLHGHYGMRFQAADNLGRGLPATDLPSVRMTPMDEVVGPLLDRSGLGLRLLQREPGEVITSEIWEPRIWPLPFAAESGALLDGDWELNRDTATRGMVLGTGDLAARAMLQVTNTAAEARLGTSIVKIREQTAGTVSWGETPEDRRVAKYVQFIDSLPDAERAKAQKALRDAGLEVIAEGAPTSGVGVRLVESGRFRFGGSAGYREGDAVTVKTATGQTFTQRITEVTVTLTTRGGIKSTPVVGERRDDPDQRLARVIKSVLRSQVRRAVGR